MEYSHDNRKGYHVILLYIFFFRQKSVHVGGAEAAEPTVR